MNKKILFLPNSANISGGEKMLLDAIYVLRKEGLTFFIVLPDYGPLARFLDVKQIPYIVINSFSRTPKNLFFNLCSLLIYNIRIAFFCLSRGVTIVHANNPDAYRLVQFVQIIPFIKVFCHFHFPPTQEDMSYAFRVFPYAMIFCSVNMKDFAAKILPSNCLETRMYALQNATELSFKQQISIEDLKRSLKVDEKVHIFTIIGDLSVRKGQMEFIEMAKGVSRVTSNILFLIIGEERITANAGYRALLEQKIAEYHLEDKVKLLGSLPNVKDYILLSDVIVLPTHKEGLPLVVLEAMSCAKPLIATNVDGIPEAVIDGETGFLVNVGDVERMVEVGLRLVQDKSLCVSMGELGRLRAEKSFGIERYSRQLKQIYFGELLN